MRAKNVQKMLQKTILKTGVHSTLSAEFSHMFAEFRSIVNETVRLSHKMGLRTRKEFQNALYRTLKGDGMYGKYVQHASQTGRM